MNRCAVVLAGYAMAILASLSLAPVLGSESSDNQVWTTIQLSVCPPVQIPDEKCNVYGLSLGVILVGMHTFAEDQFFGHGADNVIGLQLCGLLACSRELCGFQVSGLGNNAHNLPFGFQLAGLFNYVEHDTGFGLQISGVWNWQESGAGLQVALINEAATDFTGIQIGLCNWGESRAGKLNDLSGVLNIGPQTIVGIGRTLSRHDGVGELRGLQLGLLNKAADMYGVQCGLIWNDAQRARGLQLGLVNSAETMTGLQIGLLNIIQDSPAHMLPFINAHF
jgi:hypothetical protein